MGQRRRARELAIQFLYQLDVTGDDPQMALDNFKEAFGLAKGPAAFFAKLVAGVSGDSTDLDNLIEQHSHNWRLDRMPRVDRNILRLAAYEMVNLEDVPYKVSINEAVELAKIFGTEETPGFVNGILDSIRRNLEKD